MRYTPGTLAKNPAWESKLNEMCRKYGILSDEIYKIIYGETVPKWNFASYNEGSKAAGAFQFIPSTLDFINKRYKTNYTISDVLHMYPHEQLDLYDKYLQAWNYDGSVALGFMQAAPGMFYRLKKRNEEITGDIVVYGKGSRAWKANPAWRETNNGPITVGSINRYYRNA